MKCSIIGFKNVDFTPDNGDPINGTSLFLALYPKDKANIVGCTSKKFWCTPEQIGGYIATAGLKSQQEAVNRSCDVYFDENGKLDSLIILPNGK